MQKQPKFGIGNGHLALSLRKKKHYIVFGGPYTEKPQNKKFIGVKMAAEIRRPCEIDIPTPDFQVPPKDVLDHGLLEAVKAITAGKVLYVGCMAGRGRTGLFLAILAKAFGVEKPVEFVREHYYSHAVETTSQYRFVMDYEVPAEVVKELKWARFMSFFRWKDCLTDLTNLGTLAE